jgi:hypothetical protein
VERVSVRIVQKLDKLARARNLILAIISSVVIVSVMGYATQTLVYDVYGDVTMPDTRLSYTYDEIVQVFDTLGPEGLRIWSQVHLLDLLFPIAYCFSMVFGITVVARKAFPDRWDVRKLAVLPILGAAADYLENTLVASQVAVYPSLSEPIIVVASLVTTAKWVLIIMGFAVVFVLLVAFIYQTSRE